MKRILSLVAGCLLVAGCSQPADDTPQSGSGSSARDSAAGSSRAGEGAAEPTGDASASRGTPDSQAAPTRAGAVPIEGELATLSPDNTRIEFVGTHAAGEPNPRTGGFEKFKGEAQVDGSRRLQKVSLEIETGSVWTQFPKLTNHLGSEDFFDARQYPTATFESTEISSGDDQGKYTITGDLTLLETTKEISFPAEVDIADDGLAIKAAFAIDRTEFGMDRLTDQVEPSVDIRVVVGEKTQPQPAPAAPAGGGRGAAFDPAAFFKTRDADADGKLAGDEIPDRMREDLEKIDTDGDGAVSQEEFQERMRQFGGGRPAPGAPSGGTPRQ